jgi:LysR family transcriptional regulator for bpeEF and oprC
VSVNRKLNLVLAMRAFARVVQTGNFTKAADSLKMPKATVTKLVQSLESHLRVRLLQRTTRRVTVTPDGSAYYARAVRLLGDLEELETSVSNAQASPKGTLRIDVGGSLASLLLLPRLASFTDRYPEIQVEIGVSDRAIDLIGENVDCVIRAGPLTEQSVVARHVGDLPWVTCATAAYLSRNGIPKHPSDLERRHFMVSRFSGRTGRAVPFVFERNGEHFEIDVAHRVAVNDSNAHLAAVAAGLGIGQMPAFMMRAVTDAKLKPVLTDWQPSPLPVNVLYPPNRHLSARVRAFVDWTVTLFLPSEVTPRG